MYDKSKIKFNQIVSTDTDTVGINTNYLTIAKVIANKAIERGEIAIGSTEAAILTTTNTYVDKVADVAIIDRGRFKSILNKVIKATVNPGKDMDKYSNLSGLVGSDIGEVDYNKDVEQLIRLVLIIFFSGE